MSALLGLSLRHCGTTRRDQPPVPTNEDRLRAYRMATQPTLGNAYPWPWSQGARYAREQAQDAGDYEPMNYADRRGV